MKRRTLEKRRALKERQEANVTKTAQRLLLTQLRRARVEARPNNSGADRGFQPGFRRPSSRPSGSEGRGEKEREAAADCKDCSGTVLEAKSASKSANGGGGDGVSLLATQVAIAQEKLDEDVEGEEDGMVEWESDEAAEEKGILINTREYHHSDSEGSGAGDDDGMLVLPKTGDMDPDMLANLPSLLRKEIIEAAHRERRIKSRQEYISVAERPNLYSQTQISNFLKHCKLTNTIKAASQARSGVERPSEFHGREGDEVMHLHSQADRSEQIVFKAHDARRDIDDAFVPDDARGDLSKDRDSTEGRCDSDDSDDQGGFFADMKGVDEGSEIDSAAKVDGSQPESASERRKRETAVLQKRLQERVQQRMREKASHSTGPRNVRLLDPNKAIQRERKRARKEYRSQVLSDMRSFLKEGPTRSSEPGTAAKSAPDAQPVVDSGGGDVTSDSDDDTYVSDRPVDVVHSNAAVPSSPVGSPQNVAAPNSTIETKKGSTFDVAVSGVEIDLSDVIQSYSMPASPSTPQSPRAMESPSKARILLEYDIDADVRDILEGAREEIDMKVDESSSAMDVETAPSKETDAYSNAIETASKMANWAGRVVRKALKDKVNNKGGVDRSGEVRARGAHQPSQPVLRSTLSGTSQKRSPKDNTGVHPTLGAMGDATEEQAQLNRTPSEENAAVLLTQEEIGEAKVEEQGQKPEKEDVLKGTDARSGSTLPSFTLNQKKAVDQQGIEELERETEKALKEHQQATRNADSVTEEMQEQVKELLELFGVPYIVAPAEAEAQCAALEALGLVDGVVTEDSDSFPFGAKTVFKNIFEDRKYVEVYTAEDCEKELGLATPDFIALALLLGCDYCDGVRGVGIVNGMEILRTWPPRRYGSAVQALEQFRRWLDGFDFGEGIAHEPGMGNVNVNLTEEERKQLETFSKTHNGARLRWTTSKSFPEERVAEAFSKPTVSHDKSAFTWASPDVPGLARYCAETFGWPLVQTMETMTPVMNKLTERAVQLRLDHFYKYEDNSKVGKFQSERLRSAIGVTSHDSVQVEDFRPRSRRRNQRSLNKGDQNMTDPNMPDEEHTDDDDDDANFRREKQTTKAKKSARRSFLDSNEE